MAVSPTLKTDLAYIKFEIDYEPGYNGYNYTVDLHQMKLSIHTEYKDQLFTLGQSVVTSGYFLGICNFQLTVVECQGQTNQDGTDASRDLSTGLLNDSTEISLISAAGSNLKFGLRINDVIIPYPRSNLPVSS